MVPGLGEEAVEKQERAGEEVALGLLEAAF